MGPAEKIAHRPQAAEVARRAPVPAGVTSPATSGLQRIQRCAGNRAAGQLLAAGGDGRLHRCGPVPCNCSPEERREKEGLARAAAEGPARAAYEGLPVSHPAEPAEREADEVADRVMRDPDATVRIGPAPRRSAHRHAGDTAAAPQAGPDTGLAAGIAGQARGGGQALDAGAQRFMEARFGQGFDDVRVHTDAAAGRLARQVDSYAFTVGRHIFFAPGQYRPQDHDGRRLLAHELTHVVQQDAAGSVPAVRRQARPDRGQAPVPAEKFSGTLESAYRRLGDTRRAAAIRMCRERGGGTCNIVLTQAEVRRLYELAQQSGGDEKKIRAGLATAAPAALGVAPAAGLATGMLAPGIPPPAPVPPFLAPPAPVPPAGVPGYPTWTPPPPVTTAPAAEVAGAEVAGAEAVGAEAVGATVSVVAVSAVAVAALVVVCALVIYEAWQFTKFQSELEARGFIVLDDALAVCITGCHATAQPIRPFPDLDMPLRPLPEFPFPGRPFPGRPFPLPGEGFPRPDIEIGGPRRRPPAPGEEHEEPEERRRDRRRDRRRRPDQGPDVDIDPRTGEPRERPKDPCDLSPFHSCGDGMTFDDAYKDVSQRPGFQGARSSGREPVRDGACWTDGRPRTRDEALASGATHQTWNLPNGDKLATIKCCPCCIRGSSGFTGMHCTIN